MKLEYYRIVSMENRNKIELSENLFFELYDKIISCHELLLVKQYKASIEMIDSTREVLNKIIEDNEQTYSVEETAGYLGVSTKTILRMINRNIFHPILKGRKYYIKENEIMKFKSTKNKKKNAKVSTLEALGLIEGR